MKRNNSSGGHPLFSWEDTWQRMDEQYDLMNEGPKLIRESFIRTHMESIRDLRPIDLPRI